MNRALYFIIICFGLISASASEVNQTGAAKWANIMPLEKVLKQETDISYLKCRDSIKLDLKPFPVASSVDSTWSDPRIPEAFILSIPNGNVYSKNGLVFVGQNLVKELLWRWSYLRSSSFDLNTLKEPEFLAGKTVVLAQEGAANYYHWMVEVLPKLAFLEENHIEYDQIYTPFSSPFMRQTLELFGVDRKKVVEALPGRHIKAQELIALSAPAFSCYTPEWICRYLRNKLISKAKDVISSQIFSKKVFISRKKASYRRVINEDEVFALLQKQGFKRYFLEELSILEQVFLFHNAEVIIAPHGAGLVNLIFAEPHTKIVELFQEHEDDTYWYLSQIRGIDHRCVKTTEFKKNGGYTDTHIPLEIIENIIN
ncbi:MAG: hypothetical protein S4CHLAM37_04310 [Chlamydiia bacterium]|nr:hypothetical protein [Chlamydiia bacterium]